MKKTYVLFVACALFASVQSGLAQPKKLVAKSDPVDAGRMSNPFMSWPESLNERQLAYYRVHLQCQDTIVGPSPWFIVSMRLVTPTYEEGMRYRDEDYTFYACRFDPEGKPIDKRPLPGLMRTARTDHNSRFMPAQQNDRWWVIPHVSADSTDYPPDEGLNFEGFYVLKLSSMGWIFTTIPSKSTPKGLRSFRLMGDHLVYSYINNPTARVVKNSTDIERHGNPTFGLCRIDLETGEETVIATNGEEKMDTPILKENMKPYRNIVPISETTFTVSEVYRISAFVYDLDSGSWRKMTDEEAKKAKSTKTALENAAQSFLWDKRYWAISTIYREGYIMVRTVGRDDLHIPLNFENHGIRQSDNPIGEYSRKALSGVEPPKFSISLTPDGVVLNDRVGSYFWIPMPKFRAAAEQAYARLLAMRAQAAEGNEP